VSNESSCLKKIKRGSASLIFYTVTHNNLPKKKEKKKAKAIWNIGNNAAREREKIN